MATTKRIRIANDNIPAKHAEYSQGYVPSNSTSLSKHHERPSPRPLKPIPDMLAASDTTAKNNITVSLKLAIGCWVAALVMMVATILLDIGTGPKVLTSLCLLWSGLWSSYVSADHGRWRLSEISIVTALGGLMGAVTATANYFGLGLTLADSLMLLSIAPLFVGYILKSRICVLASICASLLWATLSFTGLTEVSLYMALFPVIAAAQMLLATKIRSGMAIMLAVLTAYYWITHFIFMSWNTGNLPLTFGAAALFILGLAHHRSGKATEDKRLTGSSIHIHAGWIAAIIGAIGFQYFWLNPDALQNDTATLSVNGLVLWKSVIMASLAIIFCSAIIRYKHSRISLAGIFLLTAVSALLPLMLWFPSWPESVAKAIPGVSIMPTIGVLIGSAILAAAIGMMLNGVRRHSLFMMAMGIVVLFTQAALLVRPDILTLDNIIILIAGLLASLAIGGIIAGLSLTHQAPAPRLKHT